jgi:hypothetical protein
MVHEWWLDDAAAQPAPGPWARRAVAVLLILGVFGTAYETFMIRMAPLLRERVQVAGLGWLDSDRQSAKRTYALRSLYESLDAQLPASAVIQHNPVTQNVIVHALYSGHDAAAGSPDCGTAFGGDPEVCGQRVRRLAALFEIPGGNPDDACQAYGIDVIVAKDTDGAWRNASSWIWTQRPVFANNYVRAFRCRSVTVAVY